MTATTTDGRAPLAGAATDLPRLISLYAENLTTQAEILRSLDGALNGENRAEAEAYLAVVRDLHRILVGDLTETGLRGH